MTLGGKMSFRKDGEVKVFKKKVDDESVDKYASEPERYTVDDLISEESESDKEDKDVSN